MKIIAFTNNSEYHLGELKNTTIKELFNAKPEITFILLEIDCFERVFQCFRDGKTVIKYNYRQQFLKLYNRLLECSKEVASDGD